MESAASKQRTSTGGVKAGRLVLLLLFGLTILYSALVTFALLIARPAFQVQFVPDDAFYYFTLARNFALLGHWTFDSGVSTTTGFHPIHAYFLATLYRLFHPAADTFLQLSMICSYLILLPAIAIAAWLIFRTKSLFTALLVFLFLVSRNVMLNSISGLEWSWVITASAIYCTLLFFSDSRNLIGPLFAAGVFVILSRTDSGLMPAGFLLAAMIFARGSLLYDRTVRCAFAGFLGAVSGLAATMLQNYLIAGTPFQSTAMMKFLWGKLEPSSFRFLLVIFFRLFGDLTWYTLVMGALLLVLLIFLGVQVILRGQSKIAKQIWVGSFLTILAYGLLYYSNTSGLQNWYTANFIVPLFLLMLLPVLHSPPKNVLRIASFFLLTLLCVRQGLGGLYFLETPEWPHQIYMRSAGEFLNQKKLAGAVAGWNVGIIGFYQGGSVINIDGLVNNDIYPYIRDNRVPEYMENKSVRYIIDFDVMFTPHFRTRGGYDRPDFLARLKPLHRFNESGTFWKGLTLYEVERTAPPSF